MISARWWSRDAAEQLCTALGTETFERLLASGQSMSEEAALQFARTALQRASTALSTK